MSYITKYEFTTHIYEEKMDIISRANDSKIIDALTAAVAEATGYLSKYDTTALFAREGEDRDPILMLFMKDLAKWHFCNVSNAGIDLELAKERYDMAIKWLDKVQSGKIVPAGWPYPEGEDAAAFTFIVNSNPKRGNYY
ncbi:MAG: phage protein Gp36 family protein [Daejeonella sp.]